MAKERINDGMGTHSIFLIQSTDNLFHMSIYSILVTACAQNTGPGLTDGKT